jgi:hypothetical protein
VRRFEHEEEKRRRFGLSSPCPSSLLLFVLISPPLVAGCSTHQCDPSSSSVDDSKQPVTPVNGTYVWDSVENHGWIPYNGNETIKFTLPESFPSTLTPGFTLSAYVSTADAQSPEGGGQFVEAAGQLAEFQALTPTSFEVLNATCAQGYYLRVVATVTVPTAPVDAGADATHD